MGHQWAQLRLSRVQYSKRILGLFIIIGRIQISGKSLLGAILNSCRFWYCAVFSVLSITFVTDIRMTWFLKLQKAKRYGYKFSVDNFDQFSRYHGVKFVPNNDYGIDVTIELIALERHHSSNLDVLPCGSTFDEPRQVVNVYIRCIKTLIFFVICFLNYFISFLVKKPAIKFTFVEPRQYLELSQYSSNVDDSLNLDMV